MSSMKVVSEFISLEELKQMSQRMFGRLVKAVVDIDKKIMAVDANLHADQESELLEMGSLQDHLWGINLYPHIYPEADWIEFDSMINLRPSWGNCSRSVDDPAVQEQIRQIVLNLVKA